MSVRLSVLDLSLVTEGHEPADAFANSAALAQTAEALGYYRYWVAEHHNMPGIASAATSIVINHIASATSTIRVGAGGIMLPNHAPLVIAEQFGTLESLHPGRIELGLGRAPGTDQFTMQALRRSLTSDEQQFPRDVMELLGYFKPVEPGQHVRAVPGAGLNVPVWILGSSLFGAQLAAILGLPYAFASHFAPSALMHAVEMYKTRFEPSEYLHEPYMMAGFNVFAADTAEEAALVRSSSRMSTLRLRRGQPGKLPPPNPDFEASLNIAEREMLNEHQRCSAEGTRDMVREQILSFLQQTGVDELMINANIYDPAARQRSFEIAMEAVGAGAVAA